MSGGAAPRISLVTYGQLPDGCDLPHVMQLCRALVEQRDPEHEAGLASEALEALRGASLLARGAPALGPNAVLLDEPLVDDLVALARHHARVYFDVLRDVLPRLRVLIGARPGDPATAGDDSEHVLVAGLILDLGVRGATLTRGLLREQPRSVWVWAFVGGTRTQNAFGVTAWPDPERRGVLAQLWHEHTRGQAPLDAQDARTLLDLLSEQDPPAPVGVADSRTRAASRAKLGYCRMIAAQGGTCIVAIPLLTDATAGALVDELRAVAWTLVDRAVVPLLGAAPAVLARHGRHTFGDIHRHAVLRLLLECAADRLIADGLLPAFPARVAPAWGAWLALGECAQRLFPGLV
jgi:hypothetical protein